MESNWTIGTLNFGDHPTPALYARSLTDPLRGYLLPRNFPWPITVRKVNMGEVIGIPMFTYYNETFISLGSFEAAYAFVESKCGPRW